MRMNILNTELKDQYINRITDVDFNGSPDEIKASIKKNSTRVLFEDLLDDLIEQKVDETDFERKNRIKYEISTGEFSDISELDYLYLPSDTVEFRKFERLGIPAAIGTVLFGWLFYSLIGGFFKSDYHAALIGMPIGAWLFVWLFSKAIRHPKIAKTIKWAAVIGFATLTIGTVFSNIRSSFFGKNKLNFVQWLLAAIITFMIFWMLHIFKPVKIKNRVEIKKALEKQITVFVENKIRLFGEKLNEILFEKPSENLIMKRIPEDQFKADHKIPVSLVSSKQMIPSMQQLYTASESDNAQDALISAKSFINALESQGIKPIDREDVFPFTEDEKKYFDTFGIISEGDTVQQLYHAWVDSAGNTVIRGKVRKVR